MPKAVVKLTEDVESIDNNKVVRTINVVLEMTGKGDTALTQNPQKGAIMFYTRDSASASKQLIATLETYKCWVEDDKSKPPKKIAGFDMDSSSMDNVFSESDSDYFVKLNFNTVNFKSNSPKSAPASKTLILPWKLPTSAPALKTGDYQIGASFMVNGAEETAAYIDVATVLSKHSNIENDPDVVPTNEKSKKFSAIGVSNVHLTGLSVQNADFPPPANRKIPIGSNPFRIILHPDIRTRCESRSSGSFDLAKLTTNFQKIFTPVFTKIIVEEPAATDARLTNWKMYSRELFSTGVKDPANLQNNEGHLVPFFDFWIHATSNSSSTSFAKAEVLADKPTHWFDTASKQKRIQNPSTVYAGSGSVFDSAYSALSGSDQQMTLLAMIIGHEIGHCLGLGHCRKVKTGYPACDNSIGLMSYPNTLNGAYTLSKLGDVNIALLKYHYT